YSMATDKAGNIQKTPTTGQAHITILPLLSITQLGPVTPNPRKQPVSSIKVTLNQPADLSTFTIVALTLSDDGGPNLITSAVTITQAGRSSYLIKGLAGLTAAEGTYTLTVDATAIQDPYGNAGTNVVSTSWVMDTTPPAPPSNLAISPDTGASSTDG